MGAIVLALQALFRKNNLQMWYLRPGCGKSLMLQIIGWLYLTTNAISKVTFVIPNEALLERDVAEFAGFWGSLQKNRVEFSLEMPWATSPDHLVLVDEADMLMFGNPKEFFTAIKRSHHCICFSSSLKGNWQPVLDQLCALSRSNKWCTVRTTTVLCRPSKILFLLVSAISLPASSTLSNRSL